MYMYIKLVSLILSEKPWTPTGQFMPKGNMPNYSQLCFKSQIHWD